LASEKRYGPQLFLMGDDGICVIRLKGVFDYQEAEQFVKDMLVYQEQHPKSALLVNLTGCQSVAPQSRKVIIAGVREKPYAVCFIGANFALRALVGLMLNASRLLGEALPHAFVDTEEQGRTWAKGVFAEWVPARRKA
jgi:hypothetical protein